MRCHCDGAFFVAIRHAAGAAHALLYLCGFRGLQVPGGIPACVAPGEYIVMYILCLWGRILYNYVSFGMRRHSPCTECAVGFCPPFRGGFQKGFRGGEKLVACFLKLVARILKSEPLIFSLLPCGVNALKTSFQFSAQKNYYFRSVLRYLFYPISEP